MSKTCTHCNLHPVYLEVTMSYKDNHGGGKQYVTNIDACIAPIVQALNAAGVPTSESCCGHGRENGVIFLQDGRTLLTEPPKKT